MSDPGDLTEQQTSEFVGWLRTGLASRQLDQPSIKNAIDARIAHPGQLAKLTDSLLRTSKTVPPAVFDVREAITSPDMGRATRQLAQHYWRAQHSMTESDTD